MRNLLRRTALISLGLLALLMLQPVNSPVAYGDDCCYEQYCCDCDCCCEDTGGGGRACAKCTASGGEQETVTVHRYGGGTWMPQLPINAGDLATLNHLKSKGYAVYASLKEVDGESVIDQLYSYPALNPNQEPESREIIVCKMRPEGFCDQPMYNACLDPDINSVAALANTSTVHQWVYREQSGECIGQFTRWKYVDDVGNDFNPANDPPTRMFDCTDYDGF